MSDNPRIVVYPADMGGCGRYRLIHAAMTLREQGHDVRVIDPNQKQGMGIPVRADFETGKVVEVVGPDADILVMQRITSAPHVEAIHILRQQGYTVVLDLDDDMSRIHHKNTAYTALHPHRKERMSWHYAALAAEAATLVTVSTKRLVEVYGRHGRCVVLDNWIPERYLELQHVDMATYGWPGSMDTHPDDLPVVGNAAKMLLADGHMFHQVGPNEASVDTELGLKQHLGTGGVPIQKWAATISLLGVAWAPLSNTLFNAAKSRLKCLEANSVGVPVVASPRAEYAKMAAEGGAVLLAKNPGEWYRKTKMLLEDHRMRQDMSAQARAFAATQTVEQHAWKVLEAWHLAFKLQHGKLQRVSQVDLGREGRVVATIKS